MKFRQAGRYVEAARVPSPIHRVKNSVLKRRWPTDAGDGSRTLSTWGFLGSATASGGIAEKVYRGKDDSYGKLGDFLEQVSERNRDGKITNILSVSNKYGFVRQSEQFSNRTIASEDTSCYKVVTKDDFAYNPARINVGSIARLDTEESGIVSPMYICFHIKHSLNPIFLSNYFKSSKFQEQINRRLEGSVRQCLTFESLCEIPIPVPNMAFQNIASDAFVSLQSKLMNERAFLASLEKQKQYLLQKLFI